MILFDTLYIHNSGGKELLKTLLTKISKSDFNNYWLLFDNRLEEKFIQSIATNRKTILFASEFHRIRFYIKHKKKITSVFCFANVPPPIVLRQRVVIYFQNELLLSTKKTNSYIKSKLLLYLKRKYILTRNSPNYYWAVQTNLMKRKLSKVLNIEPKKIQVFPFYTEQVEIENQTKNKNTFIYVAGSGEHKNHENLFFAFNEAAKKTKDSLTLHLTLPNNFFKTLKRKCEENIPNLNIINLGQLTNAEVIENYQKNCFIIFPSLKESFGIPLIEAAQLGKKIIASDLPYVYEVIEPSLTFNPHNRDDITSVILKAIHLNRINKSVVKVPNKINALLNFISDDV